MNWDKTKFRPGDIVRLSASAARANPVTLDVRDHSSATVLGGNDLTGWEAYLLDCELAGTRVWLWSDLVLVKKVRAVKHTDLGLKPLKPRDGFVPSNFPPHQQEALREFEAADEANQQPASTHTIRRRLRKNLANAYWAVANSGIVSALCMAELERVETAGVVVPLFLLNSDKRLLGLSSYGK